MSKWLAQELSLLSWTSRPLFAHIINFNKGVYLILPLKLFTIYLWCLAYTFCVLANNKSHQSTYTIMLDNPQPPPPQKKIVQGKIFPQKSQCDNP